MFGSYIFLIFSASLLIAVTFGVAGVLPLAISGMETDLEINYLSISLAFAVGQAVTGIANPLGGAMADKFGYHRAMLFGIILSMIGLALIPFSTSPIMLVFAIGVLSSFGYGFTGIQVAMAAINKRIPPEKSGFAFGLVNAGGSFGQFLMAPIAGFIIISFGWTTLIYFLLAVFILAIPFCWALKADPSMSENKSESSLLF